MNFASRVARSFATAFVVGIALFAVSWSLAFSAPVFTWDPSKSNPPLSGAGSAFTADTLLMTTYLHAVTQPNSAFAEEFIFHIDQFQLSNQIVATPGLNSTPGLPGSYGLYFAIDATGQSVAGVPTFNSLNIALIGDPGNNNGGITATTAGTSFANTGATGAADDIVLGVGSLVSGMLSFNPITGVRNAHFVESFHAVAGQAGFFVTPLNLPTLLEEFLTTPPSAFASVPGPGGTTITTVNGGTARANFVPEPSSLILLSAGVLVLWLVRRTRPTASAPSPLY